MPNYGAFTPIHGTDPSQLTQLNDMLRYLFSKVQGGIEYKEFGINMQGDVDMFREQIWQRNMVINSDLACSYFDMDNLQHGGSEPGDILCFQTTADENSAATIEDDPLSPAAKRAKLVVAAGESATIMYVHGGALLGVDVQKLFDAGQTKLIFSFYCYGNGALLFGVTDAGTDNFFTLTATDTETSVIRFADLYGLACSSKLRRYAFTLDLNEFGGCENLAFQMILLGADLSTMDDDEPTLMNATAYVSAFQLTTDKWNGRPPVYQPGPHSIPYAGGIPVDLLQTIKGNVTADIIKAEIPLVNELEGGMDEDFLREYGPLLSFTIPGAVRGNARVPLMSRLTINIETNAPLTAMFAAMLDPVWPETNPRIVGAGSCVLFTETEAILFYNDNATQMYIMPTWVLDSSITGDVTVYVFGVGVSVPEATATVRNAYYEYEYNVIKGVPDTDWGG